MSLPPNKNLRSSLGPFKPFNYTNSGTPVKSSLPHCLQATRFSDSRFYARSESTSVQRTGGSVEESKILDALSDSKNILDIVKNYDDVDKHLGTTKRLMTKMSQLSTRMSGLPTAIVNSLESVKTSFSDTLDNFSLRALNGVVREVAGNVEVAAWVKPLEALGAEATQQIGVIQGMVARFEYQETSLSRALDALRENLLRGVDALIDMINNCANKITECINFLRRHVRVLSGKWSQLQEAMPRLTAVLSRLSNVISGVFKMIMKKLPLLGNILDGAKTVEARNNYVKNPLDEDAQKKYVIEFLGFVVGVILTIAGVIFTICIAAPAAVVVVPLAILGAGYAGLSIYLGEDPIAKGLYALCPETMTEVISKVESVLSWLGTLPALIGEWLDKAQTYFDNLLLLIRDLKQDVVSMKDKFINSPTGERLGDFLYENLP